MLHVGSGRHRDQNRSHLREMCEEGPYQERRWGYHLGGVAQVGEPFPTERSHA